MSSSATITTTCMHELPSDQATGFQEQARSMLRERGERVTQPRVVVLATLLAATDADEGHPAFSHLEVSERVQSEPVDIDRVTLYRVLEWLVEIGLVHKVAGDDRINRFGLSDVANRRGAIDAGHAHFTCSGCHRVYCLDGAPHAVAARALLPEGFAAAEWTVTVRGTCRSCAMQASSKQGASVG
ncbi:hypothetical protein BH10PSE17_BH10PSE17_34730 [soil metagenome]